MIHSSPLSLFRFFSLLRFDFIMADQTLTGDLKRASAIFASRRSLSIPGKMTFTYSHLDELIDSAASCLIDAGILPGDVIALAFPNNVEFVIMLLAVIRSRATAVPLNAAYTQEEFEFYFADSESKLLLTSKQGISAAVNAAGKLGIPCATASLPEASGFVKIDGLQAIMSTIDGHLSSVATIRNVPTDVALFLHTSGTTSRPKGVPLTQQNLATTVRNIQSVYRLTETDSTLVVLPLFHVHGLLAGLLSSLSAGASVALPSAGRFSASTFWADMRAVDATWYTAVPTIHQIILDRHASASEAPYPKLRFIRSCSASLAPVVLLHLEDTFGAPVLEAYAMTEASHLMCTNPLPEDGPHKPGSVGLPVGQELAILDDCGTVRPPGSSGEICVKGANVTKGYKSNPEANQAAFSFGWFHTGDIGFVDEDGYLHLVGRIKELINRGGEKISPIEVDSVLLGHPGVSQAVCFGVPDEKYGEEINCALIPKKGTEIDVEEVKIYCKKILASFKVPKKFYLAESLPKTATGKIQRRVVAEHFMARRNATTKVGA